MASSWVSLGIYRTYYKYENIYSSQSRHTISHKY